MINSIDMIILINIVMIVTIISSSHKILSRNNKIKDTSVPTQMIALIPKYTLILNETCLPTNAFKLSFWQMAYPKICQKYLYWNSYEETNSVKTRSSRGFNSRNSKLKSWGLLRKLNLNDYLTGIVRSLFIQFYCVYLEPFFQGKVISRSMGWW